MLNTAFALFISANSKSMLMFSGFNSGHFCLNHSNIYVYKVSFLLVIVVCSIGIGWLYHMTWKIRSWYIPECSFRGQHWNVASVIQGDPTQVTGLPQPLVQSYVDRFQNPFSHLTTTLGDLIEHIKHLGTCTITWETNVISFTVIYRFSFHPLSFLRHQNV